jgi:predicted PurR-regulated permease PerM
MTTRARKWIDEPEPPGKDEKGEPARLDVSLRSVALAIMALGALMAVLHWAQAVFIPIVLSLLISYALEPVVRGLTRVHIPRFAASALVIATLVGSVSYAGYALSDDAAQIIAGLPGAATKLRQTMARDDGEQSTIEHVEQAAQELQRTADESAARNPAGSGVQRVQIEEPAINVREYLSWGSASAFAFAAQALLVMFFSFFLLVSGDTFKRKLVKVAGPSLEKRKVTVQILEEINSQIERFLIVHLFTSIIVGAATWLAFRMIGLEQAGIWGIAAGVFNNIPYFGPMIVSVGTAIVAFLQFGTISMALYVAAIALVITTLEGWLLMPMLTRKMARINEVSIFLALIFWSFIWGIWGTLLAVPMLMSVKACCDRIEQLKPIGELLGE